MMTAEKPDATTKPDAREKVLREVKLYLQQMSEAGIIAHPSHLMDRINKTLEGK